MKIKIERQDHLWVATCPELDLVHCDEDIGVAASTLWRLITAHIAYGVENDCIEGLFHNPKASQ